MCDGVGSADCERAIENAGQERDATAPAGVVGKVGPDEAGRSVRGRHRREDDDGDDASDRDHEEAEVLQMGQDAVEEDGDGDAYHRDANQPDEDVPRLDDIVRMVQKVHLHAEFRHDVHDGREVKEPAEVVECAGKEAH